MITASKALDRLLSEDGIESVIDVGSGAGKHAAIMRQNGKQVFTVNLEPPADIVGDFLDIDESRKYDAVWAAHVLEHQPNTNLFLKKCFRILNDNGLLAITVPPLKHQIVGGHVSLWNGGLLLYNTIIAGFDCKSAEVLKYGYNISLMVRKKTAVLPELRMDRGDIESLAEFFPFSVKQGFNGDIG